MVSQVCPIAEHAKKRPQNLALITDKVSISYLELEKEVGRLAKYLQSINSSRKKKIVFLAHKNIETVCLFFALFRNSMIACPINPKLPQKGIETFTQELDDFLFLDPIQLFQASCSSEITASPELDFTKTATMLATSGSSQKPKIACHTLNNHYYSSLGFCENISLQENDRWLLSLPLFHVSGLSILFRCFFQGASVVISEENIEVALSKYRISHLSLVTTQLRRFVQTKTVAKSLKTTILGGGPIPVSLWQQASEICNGLCHSYGLTETASLVTIDVDPSVTSYGLSLGKTLPYRNYKIKEGEILIKGEVLFQGYYDKVCGIRSVLDADGYFPTKDLGTLIDEKLYFLGRKDNMFISGGENIQPEEIENVLYKIPGIFTAFIVPIPDEEFGQRPLAFLDHQDKSFSQNDLVLKLREELPGYKIPVQFLPIPNHLKTLGVKIRRSSLLQLAESLKESSY